MSTSRATTPPLYLGRPAPTGVYASAPSGYQQNAPAAVPGAYRTSSIRLANEPPAVFAPVPPPYSAGAHAWSSNTGAPNAPQQPATLPTRPPPVEMPRSRPGSPALPPHNSTGSGVGMITMKTSSGGAALGGPFAGGAAVQYQSYPSHASVSRPQPPTTTTAVDAGEGFYSAQPQQQQYQQQQHEAMPIYGQHPGYPFGNPNSSNHGPATTYFANDILTQFHAKIDQERETLAQQDQEELALAAEESSLRLQLMSLENERRQVDSELLQLHQGWAKLFEREEWFHSTPYSDLSQECAAVHNRIALLQRAQEQFEFELEGHRIELKKFEGNEQLRNKQLQAMKSLDECLSRCDARRRRLRGIIERHFDTETARERAVTRYLSEGNDAMRRLRAKLGLTGACAPGQDGRAGRGGALSDRTNTVGATSAVAGGGCHQAAKNGSGFTRTASVQGACSRAGSFSETTAASSAAAVGGGRSRVVTFGRCSVPSRGEDAPPALQTTAAASNPQPFSALEDTGSICLGLDDGPAAATAQYAGAASSAEPFDAIAALNSTDSFAFSMCDAKRVRREVPSY